MKKQREISKTKEEILLESVDNTIIRICNHIQKSIRIDDEGDGYCPNNTINALAELVKSRETLKKKNEWYH